MVAHRPLASSLCQVAREIFGKLVEVEPVDIVSDQPKEEQLKQMEAVWSKLGSEGKIILTDLIGATPYNVASEFASSRSALFFYPLSLPLLMKVMSYRDESVEILTEKVREVTSCRLEK